MVTRDEALTADRFHYAGMFGDAPKCAVGKPERWRRNGATKTWKTRPDDFRVPVKFGLREYSYIDHDNADDFHTEAACPHGQV
jgi:hypothetical protein